MLYSKPFVFLSVGMSNEQFSLVILRTGVLLPQEEL
jgi:hypothetical protein